MEPPQNHLKALDIHFSKQVFKKELDCNEIFGLPSIIKLTFMYIHVNIV